MFISVCKYARWDGEGRGGKRSSYQHETVWLRSLPWALQSFQSHPTPTLYAIYTHTHTHIYTYTHGSSVCQLHAYITPRTHHLSLSLTLSLSHSAQSEFYTRAKLQSAVAHPLDHAIPGYALCFLGRGRGMMRYTGANIYHLNQLRGNEWWYVRPLLIPRTRRNEGRKG